MNWLRDHQRTAWICGLTLALPMVLYVALLGNLLSARGAQKQEIEHDRARIARLSGLIAAEEQMHAAATRIEQSLQQQVYLNAGDTGTVSASLQTRVRELAAEAGLTVVNSQVLPARRRDTFDHIGLELTVHGPIGGLDELLAELADFTPVVIIQSLKIRPDRSKRGRKGSAESGQSLSATLRLLSLSVAK